MLIAINGTQSITKEFAEELIKSWIGGNKHVTFMAPESDEDPEGLSNAWEAAWNITEANTTDPYAEYMLTYTHFSEFLLEVDNNKFFFCLGVAGIEDDINTCLELNIPVLDLSRALYPIKEPVIKGE